MSKRFLKKTAISYRPNPSKKAEFWWYEIAVFFKNASTPQVRVLARLCQEYLCQSIFCWSSHPICGSRKYYWQRRVSSGAGTHFPLSSQLPTTPRCCQPPSLIPSSTSHPLQVYRNLLFAQSRIMANLSLLLPYISPPYFLIDFLFSTAFLSVGVFLFLLTLGMVPPFLNWYPPIRFNLAPNRSSVCLSPLLAW